MHRWQVTVFREVIGRFANRADNVGLLAPGDFTFDVGRHRDGGLHRPDSMETVVHRRTNQVVHRSVLNDEQFASFSLRIDDAADEDTRVADDEPARFEGQPALGRFDGGDDHLRVLGCGQPFVFAVADSEAASQIDPVDVVTVTPQSLNNLDRLRPGGLIRIGRENRRAEVHVDPLQRESLVSQHLSSQFAEPLDVHPELVPLLARRRLGMRLRVDVRIEPQRHATDLSH